MTITGLHVILVLLFFLGTLFTPRSRDPPFHLCSLRRLIPAELADWSVWGIQSTETGLLPAAKIDCTGTYCNTCNRHKHILYE